MNDWKDEPVSLRQHSLDLENRRYYYEACLSRVELMKFNGDRDKLIADLAGNYRMRLAAEFAGRKVTISREESVAYPADWWQHLKERWFPQWALKRWPVRMQAKTLALSADASCLFPEVEPFRGHYKTIVAFDRVDWRFL